MPGPDYLGGMTAVLWTLIGLIVGLGVGWYFGDFVTYALVGAVFGWLGGLVIGEADEDGGEHH